VYVVRSDLSATPSQSASQTILYSGNWKSVKTSEASYVTFTGFLPTIISFFEKSKSH